jgi:hypothetical protein
MPERRRDQRGPGESHAAWIAEAANSDLRAEREKSDFLRYTDLEGWPFEGRRRGAKSANEQGSR